VNRLREHEMATMLIKLDDCLRESAKASSEAEAWAIRASEYAQAIKELAGNKKAKR
jgi:hypothetical protein